MKKCFSTLLVIFYFLLTQFVSASENTSNEASCTYAEWRLLMDAVVNDRNDLLAGDEDRLEKLQVDLIEEKAPACKFTTKFLDDGTELYKFRIVSADSTTYNLEIKLRITSAALLD